MRPRVLVVDDDDGVRFTLSEILAGLDVEVVQAKNGEEALERLPADLVITDLRMPGIDGLEVLARARAQDRAAKVVLITAHGSEAHAVQAMKLGAFDYLRKPFEVDEISQVVRRATDAVRLDLENRRLRAELALARHMVFRSDAMRRVAAIVERVAPRDVSVMISGESGTGKELVAEAIVAASGRARKPFVRFNCAALPRELAEAELFGHVQGAFTGAVRSRAGVFGQADGGTLLLDEIGELDPSVQGKLLRVLQEGELRPLGDDTPRRVDVRILTATHRDLAQMVAAGTFREDLYYRLNVVRIEVPPLRDRPEDLDLLIDHFLRRHADRFGVKDARLVPDARAKLHARDWRGNVRELENAVERMVALSDGEVIDDPIDPPRDAPLGLRDRIEAFERSLIIEALRSSAGNRTEAARQLRIGRVTLLDKLKKYGLE